MAFSPKDMDFISAKHVAAREVALALGVPPMLLGIPGDNTYSNYAEANRSFWRQTILPLVTRTAKAISGWLGPAFDEGDSLELRPDLDAIEALSTEREALWERVRVADFLTINEKRAAVGYEPVEGGDELGAPIQQWGVPSPHGERAGVRGLSSDVGSPSPASFAKSKLRPAGNDSFRARGQRCCNASARTCRRAR